MNKFRILSFITLVLPLTAYAQVSTFRDLAGVFIQVVKGAIGIMFASLAVGMIYGVVLYFINIDNEAKRESIRGYLLWGVIGIAVAFGFCGLIQILCDTLAWCNAGIPIIRPPV